MHLNIFKIFDIKCKKTSTTSNRFKQNFPEDYL